MIWLTNFYALLFYCAVFIFITGVTFKIIQYNHTPAPLKIPTTPAPTNRGGVILRIIREVVLFESLFRSNKWIWIFGWTFHFGLLLVTLRHLRYFIEPVWFPIQLIQPYGIYGGFAMIVGLIGLLMRRWLVDRVQYISSFADHAILILLLLIGSTGLLMKFFLHTDIVEIKSFFLGLYKFQINPLPNDPVLLLHLLFVAILLIIFPFSKLLHAPGIFFSPTRNQSDDPRERRHLAPWAQQFEN